MSKEKEDLSPRAAISAGEQVFSKIISILIALEDPEEAVRIYRAVGEFLGIPR